MKSLILFFITIVFFFPANSQQLEQGRLVFKVSFPNNSGMNRVLELTGTKKIVYFKDSVARTEQSTKMGTVVKIDNYKTNESYTYTERDDDKIALKAAAEDRSMIMDMSYMYLPQLKITHATKMIAGYKCTKAIITVNAYGEKKRLEVWYTNKIALPNTSEYSIKGIDGYILEFTFYDDKQPMTVTCVSADGQKVDDSQLNVPPDYTIKSMPDLMGKAKAIRDN